MYFTFKDKKQDGSCWDPWSRKTVAQSTRQLG